MRASWRVGRPGVDVPRFVLLCVDAAAGGLLPPLSLSAPPSAGMFMSWPPRTGCQLEAVGTELMPGKWVELGRDEKAFVSSVCVQMGTDFPRLKWRMWRAVPGAPPTPRHFPGLHPGCPSTPQALLSPHLPPIGLVVAELWLNIC